MIKVKKYKGYLKYSLFLHNYEYLFFPIIYNNF